MRFTFFTCCHQIARTCDIKLFKDLFTTANSVFVSILMSLILLICVIFVVYFIKDGQYLYRRLAKLGMSLLMVIIGVLADSAICWSLIAVLEFALLLKKNTVIDVLNCLFNDTKDFKEKIEK